MNKTKKNDWILIGCLLVIAIISFFTVEWYKSHTTKNGEAVVYVDGKEVGRYPLSGEDEILIEGLKGTNTLIISEGKAWIEEAQCPDKICMHAGKISKNGETIVCLPNKVVVEIVNGADNEIDISTN